MLLRQLEYFVAVARERHFARAAESCYVSQPALSTSIAKLERELSVTLIHRGQNFEGLTPEGERLVVWAKRVLAEHDALKAEAAAMRSGISATLRLGTGPTVSTTAALPVAAFCALHPLARVKVCSRLSSTELLRQLRNFELDAAIAHFGPDDQSGLEVVPLYEEQYVLLVSGEQLRTDRQNHNVGGGGAATSGTADTAYAVPPVHRQGVRRQRRGGGAAGGNGFRRIALRACRDGCMGERGATHVAARDAGDGSGAGHPPRRAGDQGADLDRDPRGHARFGRGSGVLERGRWYAAERHLRTGAARTSSTSRDADSSS